MAAYYDPELHTPREATPLPEQCPACPETAPPGDEFNALPPPPPPEDGRQERRRSRLRRTLVLQAAAVLSAVVMVESAFGHDPLGRDFLQEGAMPDGPDTPPIEQAEGPGPEDPRSVTRLLVHVQYVPTGEEFTEEESPEIAMADAREWVVRRGGDPDTMLLLRSEITYLGMEQSDDLILVGDTDDMANIYIPQGSITYVYREERWYEAYAPEEEEGPEHADPAFPRLTNLSPNGVISVPQYGMENVVLNEEFIFLENTSGGGSYCLAAGSAYTNTVDTVPGASYDAASNTLTLRGYTGGGLLNVNLMGNGFTVRLEGENRLDGVLVWGFFYGGSLTFTGDGSLTVTGSGREAGILLQAENSQTCLMVDGGVTLDISGETMAVLVQGSSMDQGVYYLRPVRLGGGVRAAGAEDPDNPGFRDFTILDDSGAPAKHVVFAPNT